MSLMLGIMKLILKILIWGVFMAFAGFIAYILFKILQPFLDKIRERKQEIKSQNLEKLAEEQTTIDTEAKEKEEDKIG